VPELSRRPDPEELLRRVQAEERREQRGRLKVFLGYAPRVGKSYRMFDEGRRRKERGEDVVVASIQGDVTPDIQAILSQLEIVPTMTERYAGREFQVLDIAGLFRRHPQFVLIDGLANDNPPGSRNPQRWQDVENLLGRGIGVITAVNVQHIKERQDDVARVREARRLQRSRVVPDRGRRYRSGGRPALALVLAANVVDRQLQSYLSSHGIAAIWGVQERILVCLTPRSNAESMLRSGMRNARRFHGALLAAYFEQEHLSAEDRAKLEANLALARELGAEVHCFKSGGFVDGILAFAREQHVTQVFLGHTQRDQSRWFWRSPIDKLIEEAADFDLRLFPHAETE
jgi:two-component system sensor histidine kinase KdpD